MNKSDKWYYQVQGQLQVTGRKFCVFVVWTPKGLKFETISRDDEFWKTQMINRLEQFYMDYLLPELSWMEQEHD